MVTVTCDRCKSNFSLMNAEYLYTLNKLDVEQNKVETLDLCEKCYGSTEGFIAVGVRKNK